jgi:hypothetical protein
MSAESTRQIIDGYLQGLLSSGDFARYFADDVVFTFMGTDRVVTGREAVRQLITLVHSEAFESHVQVRGIVYGENRVMLEADFVGTHIALFEGIAPTHRRVQVPYAAAYDINGRSITALRVYFPLDALLRQIGAGEVVEARREAVAN